MHSYTISTAFIDNTHFQRNENINKTKINKTKKVATKEQEWKAINYKYKSMADDMCHSKRETHTSNWKQMPNEILLNQRIVLIDNANTLGERLFEKLPALLFPLRFFFCCLIKLNAIENYRWE